MTRDQAVALERALHGAIDGARLSGEWFDVSADEACRLVDGLVSGEDPAHLDDLAVAMLDRADVRRDLTKARRAVRTAYAGRHPDLPYRRWEVEFLKAELAGRESPPIPAGFEDRAT